MKTFDLEQVVRGIPETHGTERFWVRRDGRICGVFTPLGACRQLEEAARHDLRHTVFGGVVAKGRVKGLTDEEIVGDLLEAGGETEP